MSELLMRLHFVVAILVVGFSAGACDVRDAEGQGTSVADAIPERQISNQEPRSETTTLAVTTMVGGGGAVVERAPNSDGLLTVRFDVDPANSAFAYTRIETTPGDTYRFSFEARTIESDGVETSIAIYDGNFVRQPIFVSSEWRQYSIIGVTSAEQTNFYIDNRIPNGESATIYVRDVLITHIE